MAKHFTLTIEHDTADAVGPEIVRILNGNGAHDVVAGMGLTTAVFGTKREAQTVADVLDPERATLVYSITIT